MGFYKTGIVKQKKSIRAIEDPDELLKISKKMAMAKKNGKQIKIEEPPRK